MTKAAVSISVFSIYLFAMGAGLLFVPNVILDVFGFEPTEEVWIRLLGLLTFGLGIYYLYCSLHEVTAFFRISIVGRIFFFIGTIFITFILQQPLTLILIGSVDLIGAVWTGIALGAKATSRH